MMLGDTGFRLRQELRKENSDGIRWDRDNALVQELILESVFNICSVTLTSAQLEVLSQG